MTEEFGIQSKSEAHGPVLAATFNENIHEIVTVGTAFLTVCAQLKNLHKLHELRYSNVLCVCRVGCSDTAVDICFRERPWLLVCMIATTST